MRPLIRRWPLPSRPKIRYVGVLDLGVVNDYTAFGIFHPERETPESAPVVICDYLTVWKGSKANPVDLGDVRDTVIAKCREYNHAKLAYDPHQAALLSQQVAAAGVRVEQFNFTQQSTAEIANALVLALKNHTILLPDDPELKQELLSVRLRPTGVPGRVKIVNSATGTHDDRTTIIALACHLLQGESQVGASWLRWMKDRRAEIEAEPIKVENVQASLRTDLVSVQNLLDPSCRHYFFGGLCVNCGGRQEAA